MSDSFDDRRKSLETKIKMDEEALFKLNAKAVRLFGLWAADKLGLTGDAATAYAEDVMDSDFDEPGYQDVLRKVSKDFAAKGLPADMQQLENQFKHSLEEAKRQPA